MLATTIARSIGVSAESGDCSDMTARASVQFAGCPVVSYSGFHCNLESRVGLGF
jgi:hypothetical protein